MNFEGKIALVTGASRGIRLQLLKRSQPVARKLLTLRPVKWWRAQAITDYFGANGKGLMLNDRPGIYRICSWKKIAQEFGAKWISRQ